MDVEYVYAAAMLHELDKEINEENMKMVLEGAGARISESKIKALIAALEDVNIDRAIAEASPELKAAQQPAGGGGEPAAAVPEGNQPASGGGEATDLPETADQQEVEADDDDGGLGDIF